jgi:hypothetical protein
MPHSGHTIQVKLQPTAGSQCSGSSLQPSSSKAHSHAKPTPQIQKPNRAIKHDSMKAAKAAFPPPPQNQSSAPNQTGVGLEGRYSLKLQQGALNSKR